MRAIRGFPGGWRRARSDAPCHLTLILLLCACFGAGIVQAASPGSVLAWGAGTNIIGNYGQTNVPVAAQSEVTAIAAGWYHTVALKNDGSVVAWGGNGSGQTTVPLAAQSGVTAIAAGVRALHTVALKNDGSVLAWGYGFYGLTNVPVVAQSGVTAIAAGDRHTVALKTDGSVVAWGLNNSGQTTVPVAAQSGVTAIAAGSDHTVALKNDGSVVAWGRNDYGQTNVPAAAQSGVTAIAAGGNHTVVLKDDGSVVAWGNNLYGQTNVPVAAQSGVVAIAAGYGHTVALKDDGSVVAWGANSSGQTTVPVAAQSGVTAIAAGAYHTVAIVSPTAPIITAQPVSQTVYEWQSASFTVVATGYYLSYQWRKDGTNLIGVTGATYSLPLTQTHQAGSYTVVVSNVAGSVTSAPPALLTVNAAPSPTITTQPMSQTVNAGQSASFTVVATSYALSYQWRKDGTNLSGVTGATYSLGLAQTNQAGSYTVVVSNSAGSVTSSPPAVLTVNASSPGSVGAWGDNGYGQTTVPVAAQSGVTAVAAGGHHTVALKNDGSVLSWGYSFNGLTNVPMAAQSGVTAIAGGYGHTVALKNDGSVLAWGSGGDGQTTVPLAAQSGVTAIAAGEYHTAALKNDGTVMVWGAYYDDNDRRIPMVVPAGLNGVVAIAAGSSHTVALKNDGGVVAWGLNDAGQTTVPVSAQSGVVAIAAGVEHTVALKNDGRVVAWGNNWAGQTTVPVAAQSGVIAIAAGYGLTVALKNDGSVLAWGENTRGQTTVPMAAQSGVMAIAAGVYHTVVLVIPTAPTIATQPVSQEVNVGQSASFNVVATGYPLNFQWRKDGVDLAGATSATFSLPFAQTNQAGRYTVVVTNVLGSVASAPPAVLAVTELSPIITTQPVSQAVNQWQNVSFTVVALGYPFSYQWRKDGVDLAGATSATYSLPFAQTNQAGSYTVVVSNPVGSVTSAPPSVLAVNVVTPGSVVAWGGTGPVPVAAQSGVTAMAAGGAHNMALMTDGTVVAWGENSSGQTNVPPGLTNVVAVAAGGVHSLALKEDGTVVAWGENSSGQSNVPPDLTNVVAVAAGALHSLALLGDGRVVAWGYNNGGQTNVPAGLTNVIAVSGGAVHSLALKQDGTVVAWGYNDFGQRSVPPGLTSVIAIAAGYVHSVALRSDGTVVAWGADWAGQSTVPPSLSNVVAIAANDHTLALIADGTVVAWGRNEGGQTNVPVGLSDVVAIAANGWHSLALVGGGSPVSPFRTVSHTVFAGNSINLTAMCVGSGPLAYQWRFNGTNIAGTTNRTLKLADAQLGQAGDYTVVVSNTFGVVTSKVAHLTVLAPPSVQPLPPSFTAIVGSNITFTANATGTPPLRYQWRKNGVNIPGATNATFTLTHVQYEDGGSYSVVVANIVGAVTSDPTLLVVEVLSQAPPEDDFTNRRTLAGTNGFASGTNLFATREAGEPYHAGKYGSNSIWYQWTAPASGIATFRTVGSTFDTLLGVYTNDLSLGPPPSVLNLVRVVADEDRGGYLTSEAHFNAVEGVAYQIAVDGFAGQQGTFILGWDLERTPEVVSMITVQPSSRTVLPGEATTFSVSATGTGLTYQWSYNEVVLPGATNTSLTLTNVTGTEVGYYTVRVRNAFGREVESLPAALEIGLEPRGVGADKLEDLFDDGGVAPAPWGNGDERGGPGAPAPITSGGFISVAMETIDYQIANNLRAQSQSWEPNHCGVLGGSSLWYEIKATASGTLVIDTTGSQFDTVLEVYRRTNLVHLAANSVACDDDSAADGVRSRVMFQAQTGGRYWVVVDGVNAARGLVKLNWSLGRAPQVTSAWTNVMVARGSNLTLRVEVTNAIPPAQYQWYLNGSAVTGATNQTLPLTNFERAQAGYYRVVVSNAIEAVTKEVAWVELESEMVSVVRSGFESNSEGWQAWMGGVPMVLQSAEGYLRAGGMPSGEMRWLAPGKYLGHQQAVEGGWLQFDWKHWGGSVVPTNGPTVWLQGSGRALRFPCAKPAGTNWNTYRVRLREDTGWVREDGFPALRDELREILSGLTSVEIREPLSAASENCGLDNVELLAPCPDEPPVLRIELQSSPRAVVLAWPAEAGCYQLEGADRLDASNWTTNFAVLTSGPTNGWQRVTVESSTSLRFFRLHKP